MCIPFTQYLRPNGRKRAVTWDGSEEEERLAHEFIARGGWFECEELSTGHASLTACANVKGEPQDIAIRVVLNGPKVPAAVAELIREAHGWRP